MRDLYIGIDSGTQSTKALVVDAKNGKVLGTGQRGYGFIKGLPTGAKEQHPETWKKLDLLRFFFPLSRRP